MKKQKFYRNLGIGFVVLLFAVVISGVIVHSVLAAALTSAYDRLNHVQTNTSTGVVHNVVFKPATTVSGGTFSILSLQFPVTDATKWCRTAGAGTAAADTENGAVVPPGTTLSSSCSQGNGSTTGDTLLFCATGGTPTWTATTLYGITLSGSTDVLGTTATTSNNIVVSLTTGTNTSCISTSMTAVDTSTIALATLTNDQVSVTATVPPLLSFSVSGQSVGFGTLTTANVYYANTSATGSTTDPGSASDTGVTASTNAPNGLIVSAYDSNGSGSSGLYKAIAPVHLATTTNANVVTAGAEGFGLFVATTTNSLSAATGFGSGKTNATTALSTTAQTIITGSGPINAGTASVVLVAAIAPSTPAGSYADAVTLTATGQF